MLLFSICVNKKLKILDIEQFIRYVNFCDIPKFPISGDDLKKYGYEKGEKLGKKLKSMEEKWIENDFILDEKVIEKNLGKIEKI